MATARSSERPPETANTPGAEAHPQPVSQQELNAWRRGFTPQAEIWNGRLAMVGVVTGSWRGGSDGWRAVPLNQPLPSDSGLRQFVIITHAESFIDLCSYIRAKNKAGL